MRFSIFIVAALCLCVTFDVTAQEFKRPDIDINLFFDESQDYNATYLTNVLLLKKSEDPAAYSCVEDVLTYFRKLKKELQTVENLEKVSHFQGSYCIFRKRLENPRSENRNSP